MSSPTINSGSCFSAAIPALAADSQVALTLRLLGGPETSEIAKGFLLPEATIAQRIVRAKRKLRDNHAPYRVPGDAELPDLLHAVPASIYLIYTEGHTAAAGRALTRADLSTEAIRLGQVLATLMPDQPEAVGLLALMLLSEARRPSRVDAHGSMIRLADQDRSRWDPHLIEEGHRLVQACLQRNQPGPFQVQAAIAAVHTDAPTAADTDWSQIVALYDQLHAIRPNPVVAFNRAVAVGALHGPSAGIDALASVQLADYQPYHAARAALLLRAEVMGEAIAAAIRARHGHSLEPFTDESRAGVDAHQLGAAGAVVGELVRHFRRDDHDVAGSDREALLAVLEGELSLLNDPGLVVGMTMQPRTLPRVTLVEDQ